MSFAKTNLKPNGQNGFSLVELLIALTIVAVGLLAMAGMQIESIKGNSFSNNVTQGTRLAQNRLEELKKSSYSDSNLTNGVHNEGTLSGSIFSKSYLVDDLSSTMKLITVSVQWTDSIQHNISLSTIRAQ